MRLQLHIHVHVHVQYERVLVVNAMTYYVQYCTVLYVVHVSISSVIHSCTQSLCISSQGQYIFLFHQSSPEQAPHCTVYEPSGGLLQIKV